MCPCQQGLVDDGGLDARVDGSSQCDAVTVVEGHLLVLHFVALGKISCCAVENGMFVS